MDNEWRLCQFIPGMEEEEMGSSTQERKRSDGIQEERSEREQIPTCIYHLLSSCWPFTDLKKINCQNKPMKQILISTFRLKKERLRKV